MGLSLAQLLSFSSLVRETSLGRDLLHLATNQAEGRNGQGRAGQGRQRALGSRLDVVMSAPVG